ncbi:MAG: phosphatase PAP2 family protein [Clostridiales bacterium]|nr:phosphatase PAP2 family protein [Clostridiales bacterium]
MKKLKRTYRRCALVVLAVLVILMVVGSFLDLQISKLLYPGHESSLGQFFAAFGELPAFLCFTCAGVLLFLIRGRLRRDWDVLFLITSALLVAFGLVMNIREACDNVPALPAWVAILVTVFAAAVAGAGVVLLTRQCPAKTVLRFLLTLVFVSFVTMVLINVIKVPWSRARMRLLVSTGNDTYFMPWWQLGGALRQRLVGEGISPDEFRSFPSGHTACAACAMLAILLPTLKKQWHDKERVCLIVGALWTLLVAVSRIWMGAHYLTDVTMACLIVLGVSVLGIYLFYFNQKLFRKIWALLAEPAKARQETM